MERVTADSGQDHCTAGREAPPTEARAGANSHRRHDERCEQRPNRGAAVRHFCEHQSGDEWDNNPKQRRAMSKAAAGHAGTMFFSDAK
jgi:hypothetical protein